jgi:Na+/H+ antiporter NhaD/arsenite permease-like protein
MVLAICLIFAIGYICITLEHTINVNKAATALITGVLCWTLFVVNTPPLLDESRVPDWFAHEAKAEGIENVAQHYAIDHDLLHHTGEIAYIIFFLMGAMTIVELVDAHEGFSLITDRIKAKNKVQLLWIIGWFTFFLSSVLDNLTTTIVMISLLRKLIADRETRLFFAGIVVIAANAGGAWTVIGDVTTTMLWIKHKIGTVEVMRDLFFCSVICLLVPLLALSRSKFMQGELIAPEKKDEHHQLHLESWHKGLFLILGLGALLSVPVFKAYTHLPPFMGMILALGVLWVVSEVVGKNFDERTRSSTGVLSALKKVDMSAILFFLGILLAVGSLGSMGTLGQLAGWLDKAVPYHEVVAVIIGLVSAVVDNVPLVAAGIEMYAMPINDTFWMLLAYCAGTGGSCLIIGSAAGVAAMGLEHINFFWYMKKVTPWALLGYFAGVGAYLLQRFLLG